MSVSVLKRGTSFPGVYQWRADLVWGLKKGFPQEITNECQKGGKHAQKIFSIYYTEINLGEKNSP